MKNNKREGRGPKRGRRGIINFFSPEKGELIRDKGLIWEGGGLNNNSIYLYTIKKCSRAQFDFKAINNTIYNKLQGLKIFT